MMQVNYAHLNEKDHCTVSVAEPTSSASLIEKTHTPIMRSEFFMAASCFPIFVMRDEERDSFVPVVQFCLEAGQNLFVSNGKWNSPYLPLDICRRPFAVSPSNDHDNGGNYDVLINLDSDLVTTEGGRKLYEFGEETMFLKRQKEVWPPF